MIRHLIAVFLLSACFLHAKELVSLELFPAEWQGRSYAFLEDFPHPLVLKLQADGKALMKKQLRVTMEAPDFLELEAVTADRGWFGRTAFLKQDKQNANGKRVCSFVLPEPAVRRLNPKTIGWGAGHNLFFRARKGSAGKSGDLVVRFSIPGGEELRKTYHVTVLKQPRFPVKPLERFTVGVTRQTATALPDLKYLRENAAFWQRFNARPVTGGGWPQFNSYPGVNEFLRKNYSICTGIFACRDSTPKFPATDFKDLGFLVKNQVTRSGVPHFVDDKGKTVPNAICPLYLIKDPEGLFWGDYYRRGIRKLLDHFPECTYFDFDYEPFDRLGTCDNCLAEFARFAKLDKAPMRSEIADGRPLNPKWRTFKRMLHRKILERHVEACRRHSPELRLTLCMEMPGEHADWLGDTTLGKVDGYTPMNYTAGIGYYDNLARQRKIIGGKAFILSMVDPSEEIERFFRRYTPEKLAQNAVATAAVGAQGFIVYPYDILDGRILTCLSESFAAIKEAEDVYFQGKECSSGLKITPVNTIEAKIEDAKGNPVSLRMPDFLPFLRWRLHRLGGSYVATLLNYSGREVFLRVAVPSFEGKGPVPVRDAKNDQQFAGLRAENIRDGFLVRIPADGVRVLCFGTTVSAAGIPVTQNELAAGVEVAKKQLETFKTVYQPGKQGAASLTWQKRGGKIAVKLGMGEQYLVIDPNQAEMTEWRNGKLHPFGGPRIGLGGLRFFSLTNQGKQEYQADGSSLQADAASVSFLYTVPKDAGFGEENPLAGLQVRKTFRLSGGDRYTGTLEIVTELINPAAASKTFGFRLSNVPLSVYKVPKIPFQTLINGKPVVPGAVYHRPERFINWSVNGSRIKLDGEMKIECVAPYYRYRLTCPDADGFYSWTSPVLHTAELLFSDLTLPPGGRKTITQTWRFELKR